MLCTVPDRALHMQESGHNSANDIISLDEYREHLFRLTDMARGDRSTRVFLATDDPAAEDDLRGSFVEGEPWPLQQDS